MSPSPPSAAQKVPKAPSTVALVAMSGVVLSLSGPGQTAGMSVFIDPLIQDLGVSRSAISTAYLIGTLSGAFALPWIGRAVDRYGVRRVLAAVALGFGAFLFLLAGAREIVGLTAGFVGARALGQGGMTMIATTAVGIGVTRRRGTALGVTSAVGAAGIAMFPLLTERLIAWIGWQYTFALEGALIWAVVLPIAWWGMRGVRRTSEHGGRVEPGENGEDAEEAPPAEPVWPLRAIVRTSMFWAITSAVACSGLVGTAVVFHLIAVLGEQGLTPTQAAANFLPQTIAGLLASFVFSAATDRFSPKLLMAGSMLAHVVTLASLPLVSPGLTALAFGAGLGASAAAARGVEAAAFPYYFGTASLGTLRGLTQSVSVASTAVAPLMLSMGRDLADSYVPAVLALALLPAVLTVAIPFARVPKHPGVEPERQEQPR